MTLFEYLAIAFSLVLSSAAMRIVGGLPHALDPQRRYGVHLVFVAVQLLATIVSFWSIWSYRDLDWNLARFALALSVPSLIYFNACTLVPENPEAVTSWRAQYYAVHRRYFVGVAAFGVLTCVAGTALLHEPWSHPARAAQAAALGVGSVGAASESPRVHVGLALATAAFTALILIRFSRAAPLVP